MRQRRQLPIVRSRRSGASSRPGLSLGWLVSSATSGRPRSSHKTPSSPRSSSGLSKASRTGRGPGLWEPRNTAPSTSSGAARRSSASTKRSDATSSGLRKPCTWTRRSTRRSGTISSASSSWPAIQSSRRTRGLRSHFASLAGSRPRRSRGLSSSLSRPSPSGLFAPSGPSPKRTSGSRSPAGSNALRASLPYLR